MLTLIVLYLIVNAAMIFAYSNDLLEFCEKLPDDIEEFDRADNINEISRDLRDEFEKRRFYFDISVGNKITQKAEDSLCAIETAAKCESSYEFLIAKRMFCEVIDDIRRAEGIRILSVF